MAKLLTSPINNDNLYRPSSTTVENSSDAEGPTSDIDSNDTQVANDHDRDITTADVKPHDGGSVVESVKTVSQTVRDEVIEISERTSEILVLTDNAIKNVKNVDNISSDQLLQDDDAPKVILLEKLEAVQSPVVQTILAASATTECPSESDEIAAAADKVNEMLIAESKTNSSSDDVISQQLPVTANQEPEATAGFKSGDDELIVIIPDESPTSLQPASNAQNLTNMPSIPPLTVASSAPIFSSIQPQTSVNISLANVQKPEPSVISLANVTPQSAVSAPASVTNYQQSFLQKLIPSLINLNNQSQQTVSNIPSTHLRNTASVSSTTAGSVVNALSSIIANSQTAASHGTAVAVSSPSLGNSVAVPQSLQTGSASGSKSNGVITTRENSRGVITIDDDDDLVVTQVIKPAAPPAAPAPTRNESLVQLVSKIKSMVDPAASNQPKLKQLQQTLAALIKSQDLSRNSGEQPTTTAAPQRPTYQQQHVTTAQQHVTTPQQHVTTQQQHVTAPQRQGGQAQQIPQRQLQALLQQAIANRTQAQQQAVQQQHYTLQQQVQQQQQHHHQRAVPSTATFSGSSSNVVQQLLQAVMSKQQQQQLVLQQQQQRPAPSNMLHQHGVSQNHANTQGHNQNLMLLENALKGSNPNLAANLKTLQDAKNSNATDLKSELTTIISNMLRMRNAQQQMDNPSAKPLKSPSLRRQIQTAHRPKQQMSPYHLANKQAAGPSNFQQLRKPVRVPTIDLSQNWPVVHHSKEKLQFLSVVGLVTRQEHQRILLSHANRKRRIEEARNILQLEEIPFEKKSRKRRRKDDIDNDGDTHDNYCSKCRMAGELLMCDKCPRVFHLFCLDPPLQQVPDGEWFCSKCQEEKDAEESMEVNVIDIMEDPAVDAESREQIEELRRKLVEAKRVRLDLENDTTDIT